MVSSLKEEVRELRSELNRPQTVEEPPASEATDLNYENCKQGLCQCDCVIEKITMGNLKAVAIRKRNPLSLCLGMMSHVFTEQELATSNPTGTSGTYIGHKLHMKQLCVRRMGGIHAHVEEYFKTWKDDKFSKTVRDSINAKCRHSRRILNLNA